MKKQGHEKQEGLDRKAGEDRGSTCKTGKEEEGEAENRQQEGAQNVEEQGTFVSNLLSAIKAISCR